MATSSWNDLAAVGAPPLTHTLTTSYGLPAPVAPAPAFSFPGAASLLSAAPPSHVVAGANDASDYDSEEDEDARDELVEKLMTKFDCNAVRRKVQRFLAEKTMTQTAFLSKIHVNSNSYRHFMSYKGKYQGSNNGMYEGALLFFHKLEKEKGAAVATSRAAAKAKGASADAADVTGAKLSRKDQAAKTQELLDKINAVTLDEPVHVYDDCDEVRKKINEFLASGTITQAALLRALDVNSNSMRRFLTTKGKREGSSNGVYLSGYCFFEKMRIAENKPKTAKRKKMEAELPTGYSLKRDPTHMWVLGPAPRRK